MGHRDIWGKDPKKWQKWCPCFDAEAEYAKIGKVIQTPDSTPLLEPIEQPVITTAGIIEKPVEEVVESVKDNKKSFFSVVVSLFSKIFRKNG